MADIAVGDNSRKVGMNRRLGNLSMLDNCGLLSNIGGNDMGRFSLISSRMLGRLSSMLRRMSLGLVYRVGILGMMYIYCIASNYHKM